MLQDELVGIGSNRIPQVSHCYFLQLCNADIQKYTIMHTGVTHTLNSLTPYMEKEDFEMQELIHRQTYRKERLDAAVTNYSKCPLLPKPRNGSKTTTNNYSTVVDSIIRPNTTYAQASANKNTVANKNAQQIATVKRGNPATSQQNQAKQIIVKPSNIQHFNQEDNFPLTIILQTLQYTMQALTVLTQQVAALSFNNPFTQLTHSSKQGLNDTLSSSFNIKSGVPQGSLLGRLLLNIYINDIPTHPQTSTNIYADDTAILATYKNHSTITRALNSPTPS
ncbi:hypothetical protein TNCV_1794831 [Trichonephila clavipes]|nr:hypothetical protein TNCV_1794831 [Trichonephila clavipes]